MKKKISADRKEDRNGKMAAQPVAADEEKRRKRVLRKLRERYPDAECSLNHFNPFQLLIATILSAQCTDRRVNMVTAELFKKFKGPRDFLAAGIKKTEDAIKSTGFYHNKAKNILALCQILEDRFAGEVPADMETLVTLPGVGRKTANVVMGNAFGIVSGFVVDTHVGRLSRRLGFSAEENPEKVERDLTAFVPKKEWIVLSHRLIAFGREICSARRPDCPNCPIRSDCPSAE